MSNEYKPVLDRLTATAVKRRRRTLPLNVALLGFGTVGASVAHILAHRPELRDRLRLTHVFNRTVDRKRATWVDSEDSKVTWTENIEEIFDSSPDVIIEMIGGTTDADEWVRRALKSGISVVTANKMLMGSEHGHTLLGLAVSNNAQIRFEAAVGGGVPLIHSVREGLAGDNLKQVAGILNGTSNYVLSRMEAGGNAPMAAVLDDARRLGYAEVDPSADINGNDAAAKLVVLAGIAFRHHLPIQQIQRSSISPITAEDFRYATSLGCTIRQISMVAAHGGHCFHAFVGPALVPRGSSFGRNQGANNVVTLVGEYGGESSFSGAGAGGLATAVAVVSDLLALAQQRADRNRAGIADVLDKSQVIKGDDATEDLGEEWEAGTLVASPPMPHYVRFVVRDRPGILASIAAALARQSINLDAVLQEPDHPKQALPFVITVEACEESALRTALHDIGEEDFHAAPPLVLPILREV